MNPKVTSIKIAGPAGLGIKSIGLLLSKILINHGFYVHDYSEYPSLVRGGHNTYQLSFSPDQIFAPFYQLDYLFAIAPNHWQSHVSELKKEGVIFAEDNNPENIPQFFNIRLKTLSEQSGSSLTVNTVALGIFGYIFGFEQEIVNKLIEQQFSKAADVNIKAYQLGYDYASENLKDHRNHLPHGNNKNHTSLNDGNESFGWGFLKAGGNFYAAYPMTPATGALHFLAEKQKEITDLTVVHPEDEISAANMILGAAFGGARAATGTSGGGFALMNEAVSFAAVSEIPSLFYLVSRPGPATGLPTWTSQGDLLHAVFSGHGEFPLVVLAPGDQEESFEIGQAALNIANQLQNPVIVVSDKFIAESASSVPNFAQKPLNIQDTKLISKVQENYKRYDTSTDDGVSAYTVPGTPSGEFLTNSYEHDELGFSTEEAELTQSMVDKRYRKIKTALTLTPKAEIYGNEKAETLIVSFGSTKGPILEALRLMDDESFAFLQIKTVWPIDPNLKFIISSFKKIIVIENDKTAQLSTIIKSQFDFNPDHFIVKYDGRPFYPEELVDKLTDLKNEKSLNVLQTQK